MTEDEARRAADDDPRPRLYDRDSPNVPKPPDMTKPPSLPKE